MLLNGESSRWTEVTRGVPQGSILGPLLFTILFVNDLPDVVEHSTVNLYADDTTIILYVADEDPSHVGDKLSSDLNRIAAWIKSNGLKMNVTKTQAMVLSRKKSRSKADSVKLNLNGESIDRQELVKYLGAVVDQILSWEQQVERIRQKEFGRAGYDTKS